MAACRTCWPGSCTAGLQRSPGEELAPRSALLSALTSGSLLQLGQLLAWLTVCTCESMLVVLVDRPMHVAAQQLPQLCPNRLSRA